MPKVKSFFTSCLGNIIALCLISAGLVYAASKYLDDYTLHGQNIEVPNMYGRPLSSSVHMLIDNGLTYAIVDTGFVRSLPANAVLDQSIRPGQNVKYGRRIELTINASGPKPIQLPNIIDKCTAREAELRLKALGFNYLLKEYVEGQKDHLYGIMLHGRQLPSGARVSVDETLTLQIGEGYTPIFPCDSDSISIFAPIPGAEDSNNSIYGEDNDEDEDSWWNLIESMN